MADNSSPKIYLLPNLMTAGNLFCGFAAVLRIYDGAREIDFLAAASDFHAAIWFILAACIFDLLAGRLARLGGHDTHSGRAFDSRADTAPFVLAPAPPVVLSSSRAPLCVAPCRCCCSRLPPSRRCRARR